MLCNKYTYNIIKDKSNYQIEITKFFKSSVLLNNSINFAQNTILIECLKQ